MKRIGSVGSAMSLLRVSGPPKLKSKQKKPAESAKAPPTKGPEVAPGTNVNAVVSGTTNTNSANFTESSSDSIGSKPSTVVAATVPISNNPYPVAGSSSLGSQFESGASSSNSVDSTDNNSTPATSLTAATSDVSVAANPKTAQAAQAANAAAVAVSSVVDDDGHNAFTTLQHNLSKFTSRQASAKANVLRLTLLPFLRQQRHIVLPSASALALRTGVLEAWWSQILVDLPHAAPSDRALYYEAISSIMARPEWLASCSNFKRVLALTVVHALDRCSQPTLAAPMQAFVGKTLAYAFFYLPNFGAYLLSRLNCPRDVVRRLITQLDLHAESPISTQLAVQALPPAVHSLIGLRQPLTRQQHPRIASLLPNDTAEVWLRYWNSDSDMFMSFLRHYFAVLSRLLPPPPPPEKLTAADGDFLRISIVAPGLAVILGGIAAPLEHVVATNRQSAYSRRGPPGHDSDATDPLSLSPPPPSRLQDQSHSRQQRAPASIPVRVDQLKVLKCLREVLHNDEACVPYYHHFALQFDRMLQTIALRIRVSNMEACASLCDLAEEWFSSLTLSHHALSFEQVRATKHLAVDWDFWVLVAKKMLSDENCHAEVRALSFLFNIWAHLPSDQLVLATQWVLEESTWLRYFCHWSPLIRSYFHRLVCYRVLGSAQRPNNQDDMMEAAFLAHTRQLVSERLGKLRSRWVSLNDEGALTPATAPSLPLPRCCVAITVNPAALAPQNDSLRAYPYDIFDNAAYYSTAPWPAGTNTPYDSKVNNTDGRSIMLSHRGSVASFASSVMSSPESSHGPSTVASLRSQASSSSLRSNMSSMSTMSTVSTMSVFSSPRKWWKIFRSDSKNTSDTETKAVPKKAPKESKPRHHRRHHGELSVAHLPPPMQLVSPRPEIERPRHKFVLVPTRFRPNDRAPLAVPRLPHSRPIDITETPVGSATENRAVYNYGARSLAEWNVTVAIYEEFLKTMWPEEMPFLVAEIPWRVTVW